MTTDDSYQFANSLFTLIFCKANEAKLVSIRSGEQ